MDDSPGRQAEQDDRDETGRETLLNAAPHRLVGAEPESGEAKVCREGRVLGTLIAATRAELRKRMYKLAWNRPRG